MKFNVNINGKEIEVDAPANVRLSVLIRDVIGRRSIKHNCGCGRCGFCIVIMDEEPIYSCLYPASKAQNRKIITLEGISQKNEYHNIIKGFELAGVNLCPNCAPSRILLTYNQLTKNKEIKATMINNIIQSVTCDCTNNFDLQEAIYLCANFFEGGAN